MPEVVQEESAVLVPIYAVWRDPEGWVRREYRVPLEVLRSLGEYETLRRDAVDRESMVRGVSRSLEELPSVAIRERI